METNIQPNSPQEPQSEPKKNWFLRHEVLYSVIGVLILVVVVAAAYLWKTEKQTNESLQQTNQNQTDNQVSGNELKTYTNKDYNFNFDYPQEYTIYENDSRSIEVIRPEDKAASGPVNKVKIQIFDNNSNLSIIDWWKKYGAYTSAEAKKSGLNPDAFPIVNEKLGSSDAIYIGGSEGVLTNYYVLQNNGKIFQILYMMPDNKLISSFKVTVDLPEMVVVPNEREVWVMNEDGSNSHRIYEGNLNGGLDGEASLSPLKNMVAFGAKEDPRSLSSATGIKIVNLDNNQVNFIPTENWHHIFSPDGKYLGYFQSFSASLSILDLNTMKVVKTISDLKYEDVGRFFDWSSDNNHFVYLRGSSLYLTDLNNNNKKLLESTGVVQYSIIYGDDEDLGQVNSFENIYSPRFTSDGKHIIYIIEEQSEVDGDINANLWQVDLDGKNQIKLTDLKDTKNNIFIAGYFENQKKLIYTKYPQEDHQDPNVIWYSYNLNTKQSSLIDEEYEHFAKFISPDGKTLIYNSSGSGASTGGIYAKDLTTGKSKLLAPIPGAVTDWQTGQRTELIRF